MVPSSSYPASVAVHLAAFDIAGGDSGGVHRQQCAECRGPALVG